ncbi:hypothetical protein CsatB_015248 [Cannabis sativa]
MMMKKYFTGLVLVVLTMSVGSCMGRNFIPNLNVDRCMVPGEYCSALPWQAKICCEGLYCEGTLGTDNYCAAVEGCKYGGQSCGLGGACCYPNRCTALYQGICVPYASILSEVISDVVAL